MAIVGLSGLTLLPGLGASTRLTYHEAIVAQSAREMVVAGAWLVPTLDGRPWLEKPPGLHWLVLPLAHLAGDVTELAARLPSAVAAALLSLAVATLAARRFGARLGGLAGCVQATTAWTVIRGRLAESDMTLACLVAWTLVALDSLRTRPSQGQGECLADDPGIPDGRRPWAARAFLLLLGLTCLVKGLGFGAALVLASMAIVGLWDRDRATLRRLIDGPGLGLATVVALAWPLAVAARYPEAVGLWTTHVADRLADRPEVFAGRSPWWAYLPAVLSLTLPWTPLALAGMGPSWRRAWRERGGADRLLWAWAVGPLALLSMASVKNAHYAIHALPPWSIWAALGLARVGAWLEARGRPPSRTRGRLAATFVGLALMLGLGFGRLAPRLDHRAVEWGFYRTVAREIGPDETLVLLYDDWDRLPYPTPFGPVPHDLAVRLYYLNRPALWREGKGRWPDLPARPFVAIARARDLPGLGRIGRVETVAQGPPARWDRAFALYRVTPRTEAVAEVKADAAVSRASGP